LPPLRLPGVSRDLQDRRGRPARPEKMALPESREPRDQLAPLDPLVPLDPPALLGLPARLDRRATQESRETSKTTEPEAASAGGLFHFPSTPMPGGRKGGIVATKPGEMWT